MSALRKLYAYARIVRHNIIIETMHGFVDMGQDSPNSWNSV